MIKYLGSKRALLPWLLEVVERVCEVIPIRKVLDPFSGSGRVAHALKARGFKVRASDYATYAFVLGKALVAADARVYSRAAIQPLLDELNALSGEPGWFTQKYALQARFFQPFNAARIEAIRQAIDELAGPDETLRAILLTSLMLAADRVDSTTGLQMAFLKEWAPRSYNSLLLEYPPLLPGEGIATQQDALEAVQEHPADLVYLDPPYNQHSYLANYHIWETLVRFDNPPTYGIAQKRIDTRSQKSPFNSKIHARAALHTLLMHIQAPLILLSFSDEGFFTEAELHSITQQKGFVTVLRRPHRRYVGAQIGIYNPAGQKVGTVSHLTNHELLFVIADRRTVGSALASFSTPPEELRHL